MPSSGRTRGDQPSSRLARSEVKGLSFVSILIDAFDTALNAGTPYVVDVKVNRDTAVPLIGTWQFPPITQAEPTFGKRLVIT